MAPTPTYIESVANNNNNNESESKVKLFPYKIQPIEENLRKKLLAVFTGEKTKYLQVGPKKWLYPSGYEKQAHDFYNFVARPSDVFIVTFPRSGTTWTQEMIWLLANNLNYEKASQVNLRQRFPFLEFSSFLHPEMKAILLKENQHDWEKCQIIQGLDRGIIENLNNMKERRFIKTHNPFSLMPPNLLDVGCKVIYVARNPKDVAVSYYHLAKTYRTFCYVGDFPQFWRYFQDGLVPWAPYWEHLKEGWNRRHEENMLFLFYEDLKKNLRPSLKKLSSFLDQSYSEEEYEILEDYLSIDNFRNNKAVNADEDKDIGLISDVEAGFIRKGVVGGWSPYFDDELNAEADRWIEENLKTFDLRFPNK
ncbi:sulfotransferase 1E1-like [Diabrotica virgifera virgifera]|uniref:Sulfotransferase domain-containing protein n=1 Tax=Diabrotica virgifera virgifera TaxID=50390 RepID=A0ABM5JKU5_DIAVI|nr:sulfotransferase 1E1-like [Diabrotica virgifera virgifera]